MRVGVLERLLTAENIKAQFILTLQKIDLFERLFLLKREDIGEFEVSSNTFLALPQLCLLLKMKTNDSYNAEIDFAAFGSINPLTVDNSVVFKTLFGSMNEALIGYLIALQYSVQLVWF